MCPKFASQKKLTPATIIFGEWFIAICRHGHFGTTAKRLNQEPFALVMMDHIQNLSEAVMMSQTDVLPVASLFRDI